MSRKPGKLSGPARQADKPPPPTAGEVEAFLAANPDFLADRPQILAALLPVIDGTGATGAAGATGATGNVVDLRQYVIDRLRAAVAEGEQTRDELLAAGRLNTVSQRRVLDAALDIIAANSFAGVVEAISTDLALHLAVDVALLCIEAEQPDRAALPEGVRIVPQGTVRARLGPDRAVLLDRDGAGDRTIFGGTARLAASRALIRLDTGPDAPPGLLALGARDADHFAPGQGTELLAFLGRIAAVAIGQWLNPPG